MASALSIDKVIKLIPENSENEALMSVETITRLNDKACRLTCHLMNQFKIIIESKQGQIHFITENRPALLCDENNFLSMLKKEIYAIDESMSSGGYSQKKVSPYIFPDTPPAPAHFDIPVFDQKTGTWYDAEC